MSASAATITTTVVCPDRLRFDSVDFQNVPNTIGRDQVIASILTLGPTVGETYTATRDFAERYVASASRRVGFVDSASLLNEYLRCARRQREVGNRPSQRQPIKQRRGWFHNGRLQGNVIPMWYAPRGIERIVVAAADTTSTPS